MDKGFLKLPISMSFSPSKNKYYFQLFFEAKKKDNWRDVFWVNVSEFRIEGGG